MMEPGSPKVIMTQQRGCKKIMLDFSDLESAVGSMVKGDLKIKHPCVEKVCLLYLQEAKYVKKDMVL